MPNSPINTVHHVQEPEPEVESNYASSESLDPDHSADDNDEPTISFLDMTDDDEIMESHTEPVQETVKRLTFEAKKYNSFTSLFYLTSLIQFMNLWEKYQQNAKIKVPMQKASYVIAVSIRKGPYMARKIRTRHNYVARFHTLPPIGKGRHHAYPSLLNNERIVAAVHWYLTVLADGEVSVNRT